jgi:hypothetical protein
MIKFYNKLQFRLTISFVLLIILISGFPIITPTLRQKMP